MVQEELLVQWESLDKMDRMGRLESQVFRVFLEGLVQWALQEIRDQLVTKVQKDLLVYLVHLEQEVTQEKMAYLEELDHLGNLDQQGKEGYLEVQDQEDFRVCRVPLERMVWLEKMERLAYKDHLE